MGNVKVNVLNTNWETHYKIGNLLGQPVYIGIPKDCYNPKHMAKVAAKLLEDVIHRAKQQRRYQQVKKEY